MALRFGRKVRLMGSEQMTGLEREREREKLPLYDKGFVSFLDRLDRFGERMLNAARRAYVVAFVD